MACLINDEEELKMKCGSPGYVAPEILKNRPATTKADIFSVGSVFFNLLSGESLFKGLNTKEMLTQNKYTNPHHRVETKLKGKVSLDCIDLCKWMLTVEPE